MGFPFADVKETQTVSDFIDSDHKVLRITSIEHYNYAGGFRGALSSGGDLFVGSASKATYQELLARPHTLQTNPLAQRDAVNIVGVEGKMTLGESTETLEIYTVSQGAR